MGMDMFDEEDKTTECRRHAAFNFPVSNMSIGFIFFDIDSHIVTLPLHYFCFSFSYGEVKYLLNKKRSVTLTLT